MTPEPSASLVLSGATVIDGTGRPPIEDAVVEVAGGRIANVYRRGDTSPAEDAQAVDLEGKTVLPGLIDSHVHLGLLPYNRFGVEDPMELFDRFMRDFVRHGVTTVRCTGSPELDWSFRMLKEGSRAGPASTVRDRTSTARRVDRTRVCGWSTTRRRRAPRPSTLSTTAPTS